MDPLLVIAHLLIESGRWLAFVGIAAVACLVWNSWHDPEGMA